MKAVNDNLSPEQVEAWREEVEQEIASQEIGYLTDQLARAYAYLLQCMGFNGGAPTRPAWEGDWYSLIDIGQRECLGRLERAGYVIPDMPAWEIDPVGHMRVVEPFLRKMAPYVHEGWTH